MPSSNDTNRNHFLLPIATFCLLVLIGVVGRWGQPDWCVTPLAATGLIAGYWCRRAAVAIAVPMLAMLISDLVLPSYNSIAVLLAVYVSLGAAALIGRQLRKPIASRPAGLARLASCAMSPALLFFITTNFACWATSARYAKSFAGMVDCYTAALPFFRRMVMGDLSYVAIIFGAAALAGIYSVTGLQKETAAKESNLTEIA